MEVVNESLKLIANVIEKLKGRQSYLEKYEAMLLDLSNEIKILEEALDKLLNVP